MLACKPLCLLAKKKLGLRTSQYSSQQLGSTDFVQSTAAIIGFPSMQLGSTLNCFQTPQLKGEGEKSVNVKSQGFLNVYISVHIIYIISTNTDCLFYNTEYTGLQMNSAGWRESIFIHYSLFLTLSVTPGQSTSRLENIQCRVSPGSTGLTGLSGCRHISTTRVCA